MKTIVLASTNPVKIEAVRLGFLHMFPDWELEILTVSVPSGVSDQPLSDKETLQGATNRASNARIKHPKADFWVGIEGGIEDLGDSIAASAWVVVMSSQLLGKARSGAFQLPPAVTRLVRDGMELGDADDIVFNQTNSKQKNGAVGILTENIITRTELYEHAVLLSLVPFKNEKLYLSD